MYERIVINENGKRMDVSNGHMKKKKTEGEIQITIDENSR